MSAHDGGPAFPVLELDQVTGNVCAQHMGMSLRDYFAGQVIASVVKHGYGHPHIDAEEAYRIADAMLKFSRSKS